MWESILKIGDFEPIQTQKGVAVVQRIEKNDITIKVC